jgi:predicted transposase YbfD/YdcC
MARTDLRVLFEEIPDPRVQRTRRHRLTDVLVLVLLGTVVGCSGWDAIERFAYERERELRDILALPGGIPSADTLRRVMAAVEPAALARTLTSWTDALCETFAGKQIAIDGKSIRGTLEATNGESALHVVNAWVCEHQMVLGQYATDVKSNEITAIPKLLEVLCLRGSTVTIDAMGCQKGIAKAIVDKDADYIFGLKSNQPSLHKEVLDAFDEATRARLAQDSRSYVESADKGHGRSEVRRVWVERDVSWLGQSESWPKLRSLILVEAERTRRGVTTCERRAYISSCDEPAELLAARVRGHWHVENKLHWVLDVTFGEDHARISRKHGAESMAVMRKLAMNLLTRAPAAIEGKAESKKQKAMSASWRFSYLLSVLTGAEAEPRRKRTRAPVGARAWDKPPRSK